LLTGSKQEPHRLDIDKQAAGASVAKIREFGAHGSRLDKYGKPGAASQAFDDASQV
jgi:hypothetical protein